jgi:hypothetical protein
MLSQEKRLGSCSMRVARRRGYGAAMRAYRSARAKKARGLLAAQEVSS